MPKREPEPQRQVLIDFEPIGSRVEVERGSTLLEAAQQAGIEVIALCGGMGSCGTCRMRPLAGRVSDLTSTEQETLEQEEIEGGIRLGCQMHALSDLKVEIPASSLTTPQRLQIEGMRLARRLNPPVRAVELDLESARLDDLRSDEVRLRDSLHAHGFSEVLVPLSVLRDLPRRLRRQAWSARVVLRGPQVVALLPSHARLLGLAVDMGTTKLAAYLVDLESGEVLARRGAMNPQIGYGEDVVSRIAYADAHEDGHQTLHRILVEAIQGLAEAMCDEAGIAPDQIVEAVMVGNTAMHHFFAGLPVQQLGRAPYVPAVSQALEVKASEVGLRFAPSAMIYMPPNIAGYVGADHVAMLLAADILASQGPIMALDIGTNTEISLAIGDRLITCSCASGPAFEGAHIKDGMRAAPGAIERARIDDGSFQLFTIEDRKPIGLCGSGILDVLAEMVRVGALEKSGRFDYKHHLLAKRMDGKAFVLVPPEQAGQEKGVHITPKDVNEIQLAKGAIRAGMDILLEEAGITAEDLESIIVAGAFGTYLDPKSAIRIGMFPDIPLERYRQIGNAAGGGAIQLLTSLDEREKISEILARDEYIELTTHAGFQDAFMRALHF